MTDPASPPSGSNVAGAGSYEYWMLAQSASGFLAVGGMMFLIPGFVLDQGGTPGDAGAVMAVAGAIALAGPAIGNFADRFNAHRLVQLGSILLLGAAALSFAFAEQQLLWMVAATCLGLGMAGLTVVNATLIVGAGFDETLQASKLSMLQLSLPSGQVMGLAFVAALTAIDVGFRGRFLALAGVSLLFLAIVTAFGRSPVDRLHAATAVAMDAFEEETTTPEVNLGNILRSQFGLTLGLIALLTIATQAIESQYPNYMKDVFNIDPSVSAAALSVIVLLSIPLYVVAGRWTASAGPRTPFIFSAAARAAAAVGLLMLPNDAGALALIIFGVIMVVYPMFELNAATLAAVNSPIGAGAGQGAMGAAMALGTIIASVLAGWVAGQIGFSSLAMITLFSAGVAAIVGALFLENPETNTN